MILSRRIIIILVCAVFYTPASISFSQNTNNQFEFLSPESVSSLEHAIDVIFLRDLLTDILAEVNDPVVLTQNDIPPTIFTDSQVSSNTYEPEPELYKEPEIPTQEQQVLPPEPNLLIQETIEEPVCIFPSPNCPLTFPEMHMEMWDHKAQSQPPPINDDEAEQEEGQENEDQGCHGQGARMIPQGLDLIERIEWYINDGCPDSLECAKKLIKMLPRRERYYYHRRVVNK